MREILFRAKNYDGEWVYGVPVKSWWYGSATDYMIEDGDIYGGDLEALEAINIKTIGQFTGLTDKNGKKIFEGDIIEYPPQRKKFIVEFYNDCFGARDKTGKRTRIGSGYDFITIGNINDNPELLS